MSEAQKQAKELMAKGYRRTSNKYRMITRIDREDWMHFLAEKMPGSCVADFMVKSGPDAGKPSPLWEDHYRRVYSKDSIENVAPGVFKWIEPS